MIGPTFATASSRSPVVREHPLNQGRLSWWLPVPGRMGGGTFQDVVGNNHATIYGGPPWVKGFNGQGGALSLANNPTTPTYATTASRPNLSAYTVSCWVKLTDFRYIAGNDSIYNALMANWGTGLAGYFHLATVVPSDGAAAGRIRLNVSSSGGGGKAINGTALSIGVPAHLVGTVGGGAIRIYLNGQLDGSGTYSGSLTSTASRIAIGTRLQTNQTGTETGTLMSGVIGDCSLWGRVLSAVEVTQLYDQSQRSYPDLLQRNSGPIFSSGPLGFRPFWMGPGAVLGSGIC